MAMITIDLKLDNLDVLEVKDKRREN